MNRKPKKVIWIVAVCVVLGLVLYSVFVNNLFYIFADEEVTIISPDGTKQMVIQEVYGLGGIRKAEVYICTNSKSALWNRLTRIKVGTVSGIANSKTAIYGNWVGDHVKVGFLADGRRESKTFEIPAFLR